MKLIEKIVVISIVIEWTIHFLNGDLSSSFTHINPFLDKIFRPILVICLLLFSYKDKKSANSPLSILGVLLSFLPPLFMHQELSYTPHTLTTIFVATNSLFYSLILVSSYFALGRNLSITPAVKNVTTIGMFRILRHPIYACYIHLAFCYTLYFLTQRNILCTFFICIGLHIRSLCEEHLLLTEPLYQEYKRTVSARYFLKFFSFPLFLILGSQAFGFYQQLREPQEPIKLQLAYPVLSLDPTIYDDWSSVFIGNHIYRRLVEDKNHPYFPFVGTHFHLECKDVLCEMSFEPQPFYACNGAYYTKEDIAYELEQIFQKRSWIFQGWKRCKKTSHEKICYQGNNTKDLKRKFENLYLRFGWTKTNASDKLWGAGAYCLESNQFEGEKILQGALLPNDHENHLPTIHFHTSQSKDTDFHLALYGQEDLLQGSRTNLSIHTPLGYYVVTHRKWVEEKLPWNDDSSKKIIVQHFQNNNVLSANQPNYLEKLYPQGKALQRNLSWEERRDKQKIFILPDYLPKCKELANALARNFYQLGFMHSEPVCTDLIGFQKDHVWPVSGDGNFDGFLSPISPGAPGRDAIRYQYFSPDSLESFTGNFLDPDQLFYLIGVGPTLLTIDNQRICNVRASSMGIGNILVGDLLGCK